MYITLHSTLMTCYKPKLIAVVEFGHYIYFNDVSKTNTSSRYRKDKISMFLLLLNTAYAIM